MATINIQSPLDQPSGNNRLLNELTTNLQSADFNDFKIISAFAKVGPLLRLQTHITNWRGSGKSISSIYGIDEKGTSKEALEFSLQYFNQAYVASIGTGLFKPTFHPKIYLFSGATRGIAYIGSNNLTVGGLESNAETYIKIQFSLPLEQPILDDVLRCWTESLTISIALTTAIINELVASRKVLDEASMRISRRVTTSPPTGAAAPPPPPPAFPDFRPVPPSSLPRENFRTRTVSAARTTRARTTRSATSAPALAVAATTTTNLVEQSIEALVIQIIPHHNGEVFLSKLAVDQNHDFFGWPFTGATVPKKATNPSYPQRTPDPIVNIRVYNNLGNVIITHSAFALNTVYYSTKSEIRITVPQNVVTNAPAYSIMVMKVSESAGVDYEIDIYTTGSDQFNQYLAVCNQTMPSGGSAQARRFGWI